MDTKWKNSRSRHKTGVFLIVLLVLFVSCATMAFYPYMEKNALENQKESSQEMEVEVEDFGNAAVQVMNFSYVLWHQQKQEEQGKLLTYAQTFLPGLEEKIRSAEQAEMEAPEQVDYDGYNTSDSLKNLQENMDEIGGQWEELYQEYAGTLAYQIIGEDGSVLRANKQEPETWFSSPLQRGDVQFTITFSDTGRLQVGEISGVEDGGAKILQAFSKFEFYDPLAVRYSDEYRYSGVSFEGPKNMRIQFRCNPLIMNGYIQEEAVQNLPDSYNYYDGGVNGICALMLIPLFLAAILLPFIRSFEIGRSALCRLSFEPLSAIGALWLCALVSDWPICNIIAATMNGSMEEELMRAGFLAVPAEILVFLVNLAFWMLFYGMFYWGITCYRAIFTLGPWRYFKERTWIGRFLRFLKRWALKGFQAFVQNDWESDSSRMIGKAVVINFVILALCSCLWFFGIGALLVYSVVLFFLLRKYWGQAQEKYRILLNGIRELAKGNLDVEITEDLGLFNSFKEELSKVQEGLKKAVEKEVQSERTKTELITNVSHDLKTPLTAIITYVNLLKQEGITDEERASYIDVLDKKSMRLKALIEDLFEISKANNGAIKLNLTDVDIVSLIKQVQFEIMDKIEESGIQFRFQLPEERVMIHLDSEKTYRIIENLMVNITKYGLKGSRAYIQVTEDDEHNVEIVLRNISEKELTVSPEELSERFVRGDESRGTEGSGLGLAIARSFTEAQGGTMKIEIEGDLFRVILKWKGEGFLPPAEQTSPEEPLQAE